MSSGTGLRAGGRPARRGAEGPSIRWLVVASLWLVFVVLPNGVTTWLGFAIIGFALLRPIWIGAAFAYFVATVVVGLEAWGAWSVVLGGVLWVLGIAHGLSANRLWLQTLWGRVERGERLIGSGGRPRRAGAPRNRRSGDTPVEAAPLFDGAGTLRSDYLAESNETESEAGTAAGTGSAARGNRRSGTASASASSRGRSRSREEALPSEPVDVNTANQRALQSLPGMTRQRAKGAIRERERLGGFSSVEQFAAVVSLQPHELVRLTPVLECSPRPRPARTFGRRVEL